MARVGNRQLNNITSGGSVPHRLPTNKNNHPKTTHEQKTRPFPMDLFPNIWQFIPRTDPNLKLMKGLYIAEKFGLSHIDEPNKEGRTLLHLHAGWKKQDMVPYWMKQGMVPALIDAGANVNARDNNNRSALHYAIFRGSKSTIYALISAGADVSSVVQDAKIKVRLQQRPELEKTITLAKLNRKMLKVVDQLNDIGFYTQTFDAIYEMCFPSSPSPSLHPWWVGPTPTPSPTPSTGVDRLPEPVVVFPSRGDCIKYLIPPSGTTQRHDKLIQWLYPNPRNYYAHEFECTLRRTVFLEQGLKEVSSNERCLENERNKKANLEFQISKWGARIADPNDEFSIEDIYTCDISSDVSANVLMTPSGSTYSDASIIQWLDESGIDPKTRERLKLSDLIQVPGRAILQDKIQTVKPKIQAVKKLKQRNKMIVDQINKISDERTLDFYVECILMSSQWMESDATETTGIHFPSPEGKTDRHDQIFEWLYNKDEGPNLNDKFKLLEDLLKSPPIRVMEGRLPDFPIKVCRI